MSPKLGDKNILCYKEAANPDELLPSASTPFQFWDGATWGQAEEATLMQLSDRLWTNPTQRTAKRKRVE